MSASSPHGAHEDGLTAVVDLGSGTIRGGFAGDDAPKAVFQNVVGRPRHTKAMAGGSIGPEDTLVGDRAIKHRGLLNLSRPMEHGFVENWEDLQHCLSAIFDRDHLNTSVTETPILLTEHSYHHTQQRKRLCELLFEELHCPAVHFAASAPLTLYASGRTTGVVVDCGDGVSQVSPIYDGYTIEKGCLRTDVGGRDVTRQLRLLLRKRGYMFHSSADQDILREVKENKCIVSTQPTEDEAAVAADEYPEASYRLPDGSLLELGAERFRAPEVLFKPALIGSEEPGLAELLREGVSHANRDLRSDLYREIVLCGGSTLFEGFGNRLLMETKKLSPKGLRVRISAPETRENLAWIGGSIFASVGASSNNWISKQAYEEGYFQDADDIRH
eukprot:gb/GECG01013259.1/.p1 GENE.gb/GECG01013259.1/~~gb/GECG01013259.1/.p1  ORF type:complete len:387 (+),score=40.09 gb/GECG01013259.1/:1-1161(+)